MRLPTFYEQNLIPNWGNKIENKSQVYEISNYTNVGFTYHI